MEDGRLEDHVYDFACEYGLTSNLCGWYVYQYTCTRYQCGICMSRPVNYDSIFIVEGVSQAIACKQ